MPYTDHPPFEDYDDLCDEGVTCNRCGASGLYWQDTYDAGGNCRPKLFEDGKPHVCPIPDDFQVLA